MNRFKLLAAAMLLALPIISACGEDPPIAPPTGSIDGLVSIEGQGLDGVSVTLSNGATATTANGGMFRFDGVEAGAYTVTISNYPDDATFNNTSSPATIASDGETVTINFPGTWIRTAAIMGTVTVENDGLPGVTVKLTGMSNSETLTDANGQYAFTGLRKGNYTVEISGFDDEDVAFGSTASTAELAVGESRVIPFEGTYLRTSAITGQVSVENVGLENVTVSLQGRDEERTATTNSAGQYTFSELRSGDYSIGITNPDADKYGFDVTSENVTIAHGETGSVSFKGILLRTASIMGTVTVEGVGGIEGVLVSIQGEGAELEKRTNAAGQFSFTELHAGDYSIGISGFDDDLYGFEKTTASTTVALQETATVPFSGIELRTAGFEGTVTVEDVPIQGVTVTVTGGPKDEEHTRVTNDAGYYMVDKLHAGTYTITISDFDANEYEFIATSKTTDVGLRTTATVAFQGDLLRTAGISGRVSVEGAGLDGINVTLTGDAEMTATTADGGQYAFTGLAAGDYNIAIDGWDTDAYHFAVTEADVPVAEDASVIQNFDGEHTRTASISGMLFLDEVDANDMHDKDEPPFGQAGIPLLLQGPGVNDVRLGMSMEDGSYAFGDLMAGSYRVLINMTDTVAAGLNEAGYRFSGELTGHVVNVAAAANETVNFPFRIVTQTIVAGAVMGNAEETGAPVLGVSMAMYPTAEDADAGTNLLGTALTDTAGVAIFHFPRAMDLGPGGQGTDHLVFIKVTAIGLPGLVVSDNAHIEVEYEATDRISVAPTAVRLLNLTAYFQWWVKSDENARGGNEPLKGWSALGIQTNEDGLAQIGRDVLVNDLPATFTIALDSAQSDTVTMGEKWKASRTLTYTHTGLEHPIYNSPATNDLGPIHVTFETQRLLLGVYREADDVEGYTDYRSALPRGDHRPATSTGRDMTVELMVRDDRNRLRVLKYDHDFDDETDMIEARGDFRAGGMKTFTHLPADEEITVRFRVGANRVLVSEYAEIETFGDDLDYGMTVGAFGEASGAGPEVRLCTASSVDATDEWCATYAYQWKTGSVSGNVGANSGHDVALAAETGHGATGDDDETNADGEYGFSPLQDGEYKVTASGTADWKIVGEPTQDVAVYHDEFADEKGEDKADSAWAGRRAQMTRSWRTTQIGLAIMGYVGNDYNYDRRFHGSESIEGVTLQLMTGVKRSATTGNYFGGKVVATTTTNAKGFYVFDNLEAGSYQVRAASTPAYWAFRNLTENGGYSGPVNADEYPTPGSGNFVEGDFLLPTWEELGLGILQPAVTVTDDKGTTDTDDDISATLHNFALVWRDGSLSGKIENLSGSAADIDVRLYQCRDFTASDLCGRGAPIGYTAPLEVTTDAKGKYEVDGLTEGTYIAEIDDRGWSAPLIGSDGKPDDDADDTDSDGDGVPDAQAPSSAEASLILRSASAAFATLYVYDSDASVADVLNASTVRGNMHGDGSTTYNDTTGSVTTDLQRDDTANPDTTTNLGAPIITIAFASKTFRMNFAGNKAVSTEGATVKIEGGVADKCSTTSCEVGYNPTVTGTGRVDGSHTDTIKVTVTAANGYNDHLYRFSVARANPQDNGLATAAITPNPGGVGTLASPWTVSTASATATTVDVHINLKNWGTLTDRNARCAQTLVVKKGNGEELKPRADDRDDICENERYRFSVASSAYQLEVTSEDGVKATYYLVVSSG